MAPEHIAGTGLNVGELYAIISTVKTFDVAVVEVPDKTALK